MQVDRAPASDAVPQNRMWKTRCHSEHSFLQCFLQSLLRRRSSHFSVADCALATKLGNFREDWLWRGHFCGQSAVVLRSRRFLKRLSGALWEDGFWSEDSRVGLFKLRAILTAYLGLPEAQMMELCQLTNGRPIHEKGVQLKSSAEAGSILFLEWALPSTGYPSLSV